MSRQPGVLPAAVLRALSELAQCPGAMHLANVRVAHDQASLEALAWVAAICVAQQDWGSTMERAAAQSFCHALRLGDLDRASRCAIWIYAPDEAFRKACAEVHAERVANARASAVGGAS